MRHFILAAVVVPFIPLLAGCDSEANRTTDIANSESANSAGWAGGGGVWGGGGGNFGGGGGEWGGGGGLWGGGGGFWGGGGGNWGGGGGLWGGGGGQWGGGDGNVAAGGGYWGGGGGWWGGGGGNFGGGGGNWGGGGGLWGGGFANTFPFLGWTYARHWNFRGVPKQGYSPENPPAISGNKDLSSCPVGTVRLGGFAYNIDVEDWPGYVALGYHKALCIPSPGASGTNAGDGLTMNATVGDPSLSRAGGYALTRDLTNAPNDVTALKSMVGWSAANVATQYAGALCASIGSLAAAKRSCGVGIAFTDPNRNKDNSLSQRGVSVNSAQSSIASYNTPFGRAQGFSLYGEATNDMESYAGHVLQKHSGTQAPTAAPGIDAWNDANRAFSFNDTNFVPVAMSASTNATKLFNDANKSVTSPLNMIPVDKNASTPAATSGNVVLNSDMEKSVQANLGDLYALSLHSLAFHQSPLYGSGGGRWFFHAPDDGTKPLMDLSSIFQGSTYVLTGQLSGTPATATLSNPYISQLSLQYADWRAESSTGTLYTDRSGQLPLTIATDADRDLRLAQGLSLTAPPPNLAVGTASICATSSAGGRLSCWGYNDKGQLGNGSTSNQIFPLTVSGMSNGVAQVASGGSTTCAVTTAGSLKCWGDNSRGQLGNGTTTGSLVPGSVTLSQTVYVGVGFLRACALSATGGVSCWGNNTFGGVGDGTKKDRLLPVALSALSSGVAAIAVGSEHSCALLRGGTVKCWGRNDAGQLGNGSLLTSTTPVPVLGLSGVTAIAASSSKTCALLANRTLRCWGGMKTLPETVDVGAPVASIAMQGSNGCVVTTEGSVKCWGDNAFGQVGNGTATPGIGVTTPTTVPLPEPATAVGTGNTSCARLRGGTIKCWGRGDYGQMGNYATLLTNPDPKPVDPQINNAALVASQGSVLVNKYASASGQVAGHIMPIPYSMTNATSGKQALIVTYDPLAVAAAEFIEQYPAHVDACIATTNETDIVEDDGGAFTNGQKQGKRLWACSNPTAKQNYLNGMQAFLNGARQYLFGYSDGSLSKYDATKAHLPYTLWVPDYLSAGAPYYGGADSATYKSYFTQVNSAMADYRSAIIGSNATSLEKALQLVGTAKFTTNNAVVTSRVARSGNYGTDCVVNDGFSWK